MMTRFPNWFRHNAIARAEIAYQQRHDRTRRGWRIVAYALRYAGLVLGLILAGGVFVGSLLQRDAYPITVALGILPTLFCGAIVIAHYVLQFRTLVLATNSLAREREGQTWDILLLTGISSMDVIRGKWWAVIQRQYRSYTWLGVLRACAIVWFGYDNSRRFTGLFSQLDRVVLPSPLELLFIFAMIVLVTLLNLCFTTACGVLGSALSQGSRTALARGIGLRILLGILPFVVFVLPILLLPQIFGFLIDIDILEYPVTMIAIIAFSLVDNGVLTGIALSTIDYIYGDVTTRALLQQLAIIITILLTPLVYIGYTRLVLRRAERRLQKLGVSE